MKLPKEFISNNYFNNGQELGIYSYLSDESDLSSDEADSPTLDGDFSEYLWMENEEEFEQQVMKEFEEEALMEQCIEAMLDDVMEEEVRRELEELDQVNSFDIVESLDNLRIAELVIQSKLNPNASEFVPRCIQTVEPIQTEG